MKREADMAIWVASLSETWVDIEKTPSVMGMMPVFVKLAFWFGYWSAYEPGAIEADLLEDYSSLTASSHTGI